MAIVDIIKEIGTSAVRYVGAVDNGSDKHSNTIQESHQLAIW